MKTKIRNTYNHFLKPLYKAKLPLLYIFCGRHPNQRPKKLEKTTKLFYYFKSPNGRRSNPGKQ